MPRIRFEAFAEVSALRREDDVVAADELAVRALVVLRPDAEEVPPREQFEGFAEAEGICAGDAGARSGLEVDLLARLGVLGEPPQGAGRNLF